MKIESLKELPQKREVQHCFMRTVTEKLMNLRQTSRRVGKLQETEEFILKLYKLMKKDVSS
jgi:hypothetical protein